jgi:hypothetical protein
VEIEWLMLADSAQVVLNKLYLLGGGWDSITFNKDVPQHFAIAVSIKVPWDETNQKHTFEIEVLSEDKNTEELKSLAKMGGKFEVGRAAGIPVGREQRIQLALNMGFKFDSPGTKRITASIDGTISKQLDFNVISTQKIA